jgi:hypothetical protein
MIKIKFIRDKTFTVIKLLPSVDLFRILKTIDKRNYYTICFSWLIFYIDFSYKVKEPKIITNIRLINQKDKFLQSTEK